MYLFKLLQKTELTELLTLGTYCFGQQLGEIDLLLQFG